MIIYTCNSWVDGSYIIKFSNGGYMNFIENRDFETYGNFNYKSSLHDIPWSTNGDLEIIDISIFERKVIKNPEFYNKLKEVIKLHCSEQCFLEFHVFLSKLENDNIYDKIDTIINKIKEVKNL